jgi:hypothetical protein
MSRRRTRKIRGANCKATILLECARDEPRRGTRFLHKVEPVKARQRERVGTLAIVGSDDRRKHYVGVRLGAEIERHESAWPALQTVRPRPAYRRTRTVPASSPSLDRARVRSRPGEVPGEVVALQAQLVGGTLAAEVEDEAGDSVCAGSPPGLPRLDHGSCSSRHRALRRSRTDAARRSGVAVSRPAPSRRHG